MRVDVHLKLEIVESHLLKLTGSILEHPYFCGCLEKVYIEFPNLCNVEKFIALLKLEFNNLDCKSRENSINQLFALLNYFANGEDDYYLDDLTLLRL